MPAYVIVQVDVTDPATFETYRAQVPATLAKYGGEYVVRGGKMEVLEGTWAYPRCVVLKFPDMAAAKLRLRAWPHHRARSSCAFPTWRRPRPGTDRPNTPGR